ncbi:DNA alkylation repair protein [Pelagibacterium montanilacus]|uniref:DNA alkylation repair protein n=1 Tax=Pelagibacterium montanilacus TaxID=2185280 RepID=UPI000F8D154D|nr:DNA alkylation repair protein [Pelagibacterium montanilacus]
MSATVDTVLAKLEALGAEPVRARYQRNGAGENVFGVRLGDIRKVHKAVKGDTALAQALWRTGNLEARLLATLMVKPQDLTVAELERMEREIAFVQVADWFNAYVLKAHPEKEAVRERWMADENLWVARAGWSLTAERIDNNPDGLDIAGLLDRIEAEMGAAAPEVQWTMNFCLAGIGINFPVHRERAMAIGEAIGAFRDYPVSKGCTSPFAPLWIEEIVRRKAEG